MKFISQSESLRLVLEARKEIREGREVTLTPGRSVTFKKGVFETDDKDLIKELQSLPNYRRDFGPEREGNGLAKPKSRKAKAPIAKPSKKSAKLNK